jgi:tetratricopeptide (TPR) repeat protein
MTRRRRWLPYAVGAGVVVAFSTLGVGMYLLWLRVSYPEPESARYQEYVRAFQVGLAELDAEVAVKPGDEKMSRAIGLIPREPAAWANRGLMHLRANQYDEAAADLKRAQQLAPESGEIEALLGLLADRQGRWAEAVAHYRKARACAPRDVELLFALAQSIEKEGGPDADIEYQRLMEDGLRLRPDNLFLLREWARAALRAQDRPALRAALARFAEFSLGWHAETREELAQCAALAEGPLPGEDAAELFQLGAFLVVETGFGRDMADVVPSDHLQGRPIRQFLRLKPMRLTAAAPDLSTTFAAEPLRGAEEVAARSWDVALPVWLARQSDAAVFVADGREARRADSPAAPLPFPGGPNAVPPTAAGVLAVDWDDDFRADLVLAGAGGLRFYHQEAGEAFADVTNQTGLAPAVLGGDYFGAWAADFDGDGRLDLLVAPRSGPPRVLYNNGDGTFTHWYLFPDVRDVRSFVWADLDGDGTADVALLDARGGLSVFTGGHAGRFRRRPVPDSLGPAVAMAAAGVNADGLLNLLVLGSDGVVRRLSDVDHGRDWDVGELARWGGFPEGTAPGAFRLLAADLDDNGALDLVAAGPGEARVWLADEHGRFASPPVAVSGRVFAAAGLSGGGRLDLLAVAADGRPARLVNRGAKRYHRLELRPEAPPQERERVKDAAGALLPPRLGVIEEGSCRINAFALGGEVEARSGLLVQRLPAAAPLLHFGLGESGRADVIRVRWPDGELEIQFDLAADQRTDRLKRLQW